MPAAAVTPAPRVSVVDAAVKESVVMQLEWDQIEGEEAAGSSGVDRVSRMHARAMECQDRMWTSRGEGG